MRDVVRMGVRAGLVLGMACAAAWGQTQGQAGKPAAGQQAPIERRGVAAGVGGSNVVVERVLREWPAGKISTVKKPGEWSYEEGVLLDGVVAEWRATGDGRLFSYVKDAVDASVDKSGAIHMDGGAAFPVEAHSLDNIEMGRSAVVLYRVLQQEKYYKAAKFLHDQVLAQPKNASGGYWHKQIYPDQMWLDGAYMAEPFMANYARTFHQPQEMDGVAGQLLLMDTKLRDKGTGLLRHGWDESKKMDWADKTTGQSPEIWGRAVGWYAMALVDVLEQMPETDPQRAAVADVARRVLMAVVRYQDPATGLWWQVMDKGGVKGNYLEASSSCMFVYAMAKAMRMGVVGLALEGNVSRGWNGIQTRFVKPDGTFGGTVLVAGLGGNPYRSGTFEYYTKEPVGDNDAKGVGAYLLALSEMTQRARAGDLIRKARGRTVLVDAWFNSQKRKSADGEMESFHYKWNDDSNSGYSFLGRMFQQYGMRTEQLDHAPRADDLKGVDVYVIVSPDIPALNPVTHYMDKESADAIEAWVKAGGVLVEMENDNEHADQTHLDLLSDRFGIHYNAVDLHREVGDDYSTTMINIPAGTGGIFREAHKGIMKEVCTITVSGPAKAILMDADKTDVLMAVSHVGKGLVYANVDPWVYNEYTDGRHLPLGEDNFAGGQELVKWLVVQAITH
jgi:unsaturated rhamnogalacturonyl hydrolase